MPGFHSKSLGLGSWLAVAGSLVFLWPSTASADSIIHPIVVIWPVAWFALVPVVLVEAAVARKILGWSYGRAFRMATVANLFSTLIGVPVGTCLNPLPLLGHAQGWWFLPAMALPLYGVSVVCEALVANQFMEPNAPRRMVWRWALVANAVSYLLILVALALLEWSWMARSAKVG
jgi:hypothetical protein